MLFSTAQAQTAAPAASGDFLVSMLPLVLIFVVFYFLLIRPQQQRMKAHRKLIEAVKRGDEVVTAGGIYGKVTRVEDMTLTVQIAKDVDVKVAKGTITDVLNKTVPPAGNDNAKATAAGGFMGKFLGKK
ncbi:MAG: preprotein translocase subunit YajC [Geminicoccaceae bacterium]|nr:preprotein translocase subunit YajC [Geminicoccaceae bacterium]